jgi:hypothetical protein
MSCKTDDYLTYGDDARIQFGPAPKYIYNSSYQLRDTLKSYTFVYENASVLEDTVFFDIYTMGRVSNVDRPFQIKQIQIEGADNCVAGIHYKSFDDPSVSKYYVIKADSTHQSVRVILLRDPSLKEKAYSLRIEIEANDNFSPGEMDKLWRRVDVADRLIRPNSWNTTIENSYLGKYSYVKHSWMVAQTGLKWDEEFIAALSGTYAELAYWKAKFKELLTKYNSNPANPDVPLTDENGILVTF